MATEHRELGTLRRHFTAYLLAGTLAFGTAVPAFASESDADVISEDVVLSEGEQTGPAEEPSAPSGSSSDANTSEAPAPSVPVVNETVPLSPKDQPIAEESVADGTADKEDDTEESEEDTETCVWTKDGSVWSTSRGGSAMTITDAMAFGIDVSEWQADIDWARAKADGVEFAILRCAYGSEATGHADHRIFENIQGCKENNIPFGIYLYSIATTSEESAEEASFALSLLEEAGVSPNDLIYPVYLDMEDDRQKDMDPALKGDIAEVFCTAVQDAGYVPGIYANQYWFNRLLTDSRFDTWTKWTASYPSVGEKDASSSYTGSHQMWQCMSRGVIDGISTRVDINFDYRYGAEHYSSIYDYEYYLTNNPDIAEQFADDPTGAFSHFMTTGMAEGRPSAATFDLHGYFNSNADLRREFGLDLKSYYLHYLNAGEAEGRSMMDWTIPRNIANSVHVIDFSSIYDPFIYLDNNPDLREVYVREINGQSYLDDAGLFRHFISTGMDEGRIAR